MRRTLGLFSVSRLERGRIPEPGSDLRDLGAFKDLEETVARSLQNPGESETSVPPLKTQVSSLKASLNRPRPLLDEALLQKLIQYRNQIPTSSRIIRANET